MDLISLFVILLRFLFLKKISPVKSSWDDNSLMIESAVRLFPLPDSPTIHVVLPSGRSNEIFLTNLRSGFILGKILKLLILRIIFFNF